MLCLHRVAAWRVHADGRAAAARAGPAELALLSDGHLLVGMHNSLEMEVIDPDDLDGDPFVTSIPLGSRPIALARLGDRVFVATFHPVDDRRPRRRERGARSSTRPPDAR